MDVTAAALTTAAALFVVVLTGALVWTAFGHVAQAKARRQAAVRKSMARTVGECRVDIEPDLSAWRNDQRP